MQRAKSESKSIICKHLHDKKQASFLRLSPDKFSRMMFNSSPIVETMLPSFSLCVVLGTNLPENLDAGPLKEYGRRKESEYSAS